MKRGNNSTGKKKTLYGRYDDYDLTDPAEDGFDHLSGDWDGGDGLPAVPDNAPARRKKENHAIRLTDLEGAGSPSALSVRRPTAGKADKASKAVPKETLRQAGEGESSAHPAAGRVRMPRSQEPQSPMVAAFCVTRIRAEAEGTHLTVTLEGTTADGTRLRRDITVTVEQYAALSLRQGDMTAEQAYALIRAGDLCLAIRKGLELLGYGDVSVRRMVYKLTARGVTRAVADEAAAWLQSNGLIREDDAALRRAVQDARKLWGPRRIAQDLRAQGYAADAVSEAMDALMGADLDPQDPLPPDCVDFLVNCAAVIRRKYGGVPDDRDERRKMIAALMRLGYDTDMIREAAADVMRET